MHYTILFYLTPTEFADRTDPEQYAKFWANFMPYMQALQAAGIVVTGSGLQDPKTATTLRNRDGKMVVEDGPYAETKEQLGGFFIIDVPDLDTALEWASKYPGAPGCSVEVRPNTPRVVEGN